ncbi:hypothetical protein GC194_12995 [bacterium]|nr:hypothetical protein [bacterium]
MLYFLLAVLFGIAIYLVFKYIGSKSYGVFAVVLINYPVCILVGGFHVISGNGGFTVAPPIWKWAAGMGVLFVTMFYLMATLTRQSGVAVSSVVSRVSLVIPVVFFHFFYQAPISGYGKLGVLVAVLAVLVVNVSGGNIKKLVGWLPLVVFVGYGLVDVGLKLAQNTVAEVGDVHHELTLGIFAFAGLYGWVLKFIKKIRVPRAALFPGIVLGLINYYSIYFFLQALQKSGLSSAVIFPLNGVLILLGANLGSWLLFKESLSKTQKLAVLLAIIAIVLLNL